MAEIGRAQGTPNHYPSDDTARLVSLAKYATCEVELNLVLLSYWSLIVNAFNINLFEARDPWLVFSHVLGHDQLLIGVYRVSGLLQYVLSCHRIKHGNDT